MIIFAADDQLVLTPIAYVKPKTSEVTRVMGFFVGLSFLNQSENEIIKKRHCGAFFIDPDGVKSGCKALLFLD